MKTQTAIYKVGRDAPEETNRADTLILNFPASELCKAFLFKPPSLRHCILEA